MSSSDGAPTIGAPFNPWRRFLVACVPDPLLRSNLVSNGAKLCWAQLARHAGKDGNCFPRQSTLAAEIGVTDRMIRYYLRELENSGLLRTIPSVSMNRTTMSFSGMRCLRRLAP